MININELRIGSYVKCKKSNDSKVYKVCALDGINLKIMLNGVRQGEWYKEDIIKPIKITKQVYDELQISEDIEYSEIERLEIKYVHDLQNYAFIVLKLII